MSQAIIKLPRMHLDQRKILQSPVRNKVLSMGRRWGKSTLAVSILSDSPKGAINGFPVALFAPSYKLLDASFRELKTVLRPIIKRTDTAQKRIELITGGSIDCFTLLDEDAGRSRKFSIAVLDEAAHCRNLEDIWNKSIRATLTDYQGSAWFMSSPNGHNYYKTGLFDRGIIDSKIYDPNWASYQLPTSSNPHISKDEILIAKKELPELVFDQEYNGSFVSVEGALLRPSYIKEGEPPDNVPLTTVIGTDLALTTKDSSDYTAIVVLSKCPKGNLYVREVLRFRGQFNEVMTEIKRMYSKWKPKLVAIEKVAFQTAIMQELLRTTTLNVVGLVPTTDKVTRFQPLVSRYEQGLVYHSKKLIPEFEKELLTFPLGKNDDMVDGFSLAFKALNHTGEALGTFSLPNL